MKIISECLINNKNYHLSHYHLVLELNNSGRGYIIIEAGSESVSFIGQTVQINLGTHDYFYHYFLGIVEQEQEQQPGFVKLFIREKCAIFEKPLNCAIRHATLKQVGAFITNKTGIIIKCPEQNYSSTPIPNVTHCGSGYQLLNNLGRLFNIPNYVWQQAADGSVYVGSHKDSRWAEKPITIDSDEANSTGNNQMKLPIYAAIRPGAIVNNKIINKTEIVKDELILSWQDLDESGLPKQKNIEQRMLEKQYPELAGGYHLPKYAKVVGIADPSSGGDIADSFRPKYAVELQLLTENGDDDTTTPIYSAVPLPVTSTASQGGDFAFPEIGTIVEIGYAYGRPDKPFVRTLLAQDKTVPSVAIGEQLKQQRPEVFERTDAAGNKTRATDQTITDQSYIRVIETDQEQKTIGTSNTNIDADNSINIGGNQQIAVIGNISEVTASNRSLGVGGDLIEKVKGVAERISDTKNRMVAPLSYVGSEEQNIFRLLEDLIQVVIEIAETSATHNHGGVQPVQSGTFSQQSNKAQKIKSKLSSIIE